MSCTGTPGRADAGQQREVVVLDVQQVGFDLEQAVPAPIGVEAHGARVQAFARDLRQGKRNGQDGNRAVGGADRMRARADEWLEWGKQAILRCGVRRRQPEEHHVVRLGPRPGHDQFARDRVRPRRRDPRVGAPGIPADLSAAGLGRARPDRDLGDPVGRAARSAGQGAHRRARHRGDRHHEPARDDRAVGARDRAPDRQRDRLAGPPHRADVRRAARGGAGADVRREDRPRARRVLLRHQGALAARPRRRRARARAARRARVRHDRQLARVAADRRPRALHGREQREPHAALRHPDRRLGRRPPARARRAARGAAARRRVVRRLRRSADRRRERADRGHRRRPAGGALRAGVPRAGTREEHVRHRVLPAHEHRRQGRRVAQQPAHDGRLEARRRARLRARRQRVHRRRRRAVAARRPADHPQRRRDRGARGDGPGQRRRVPRARVRGAGRAALGRLCARDDHGADARRDARPHRARRARSDRVPERRRARGDGKGRRDHAVGTARRRRRRRERPADAIPGGPARRARRAAEGARDDGAGRRVSRRARRRLLAKRRRHRRQLAQRPALRRRRCPRRRRRRCAGTGIGRSRAPRAGRSCSSRAASRPPRPRAARRPSPPRPNPLRRRRNVHILANMCICA